MQVLGAGDATTKQAAAVVAMVENREFLDVEMNEVARGRVLITN
jgi:hypothetical protein